MGVELGAHQRSAITLIVACQSVPTPLATIALQWHAITAGAPPLLLAAVYLALSEVSPLRRQLEVIECLGPVQIPKILSGT